MTKKWTRDAMMFELHAKRYPVEAYQEILCEAASCGIDYAIYCLTKDSLSESFQNQEASMIKRLEMTSFALDMKLIKATRITLPGIFQDPKIVQINEFGEIVSALIGLPSLVDYQKQRSKELEFIKKRER